LTADRAPARAVDGQPDAKEAQVRVAGSATAEHMPFYVGFGAREPDPYGTDEEVGPAIPAAMAVLGLMFVCCVLLVTGLPPLPGFIAKLALLRVALDSAQAGGSAASGAWSLAVAAIVSGFAGIVATARIGMRLFWSTTGRRTPRLRFLEAAPAALLVLACLVLTAAAAPVMTYLDAAAHSLHEPQTYVRAVLSPAPGTDGRREAEGP
jgi:multicomponent K+:H+ antiporter subunit D